MIVHIDTHSSYEDCLNNFFCLKILNQSGMIWINKTTKSILSVIIELFLWFISINMTNLCYSFQLMKHVRLPLISREFLMTHVDTEVLVRENAECKELLLEGWYFLLKRKYYLVAISRTFCAWTKSNYIINKYEYKQWIRFSTN